ncbi:S-layer family protein [Desertifilum sp. FACHB-1129]|nr:S-layer family protein [Desertifilum sp. FACHB-1129]MBD2323761.1 S-layer family protein [Desertifilum sp. FACHB-866]MBD2333606.1 S-layer family protein [Desertifilum sp. FACHB-868]
MLLLGWACLCPGIAIAQIIPDGSLNTTVIPNGDRFTILNGTSAGNNLFHSFQQFSVPTGGAATFDLVNTPNISTIFSRVTGGGLSQIDGLIETRNSNQPVSLFLLNPNGILFGPNARVNLSGSFVATTAEGVLFADGVQWQTNPTAAPPLLTISVPVGLQLGANAGNIQVNGIPADNFRSRPAQVFAANAISFVANEINFDNSTLSAPNGRVQLWALRNGEVELEEQKGWRLTTASTPPEWGLITLRQSSYLDTTPDLETARFGLNGGAIDIRGRGLTLQEGSSIETGTGSFGQGENLTVRTTEFVDLLGVSSELNFPNPGLYSNASGERAIAGDIIVETERLRLANGARLQSGVNARVDPITSEPIWPSHSRTGAITVQASEVEVLGYNPTDTFLRPSAIATLLTAGTDNVSSPISIDAQQIRLQDGGRISTDVVNLARFGVEQSMTIGISGDISIRATESIEISGSTPFNLTSAIISSIQPVTQGQGGNISIETGRLSVSDGGGISSALSGSGTAGNIRIRVTEMAVSDPTIDWISQTISGITVAVGEDAKGQGGSINLVAERLRVFNGGQIISSTDGEGNAGSLNLWVNRLEVQGSSQLLVEGEQQTIPSSISASSTTNFDAGSVRIFSDTVRVRDGAVISVSNSATGNAGNLTLNAREVFLDNQASLQAEVNGGSQGNIRIRGADAVVLRRGSNITTNASEDSTGGNIEIESASVVAVREENSDIVANAVRGSGGNIQIATQSLLGLQNRDRLTDESDITASSQFGLSGTVQINTLDVDPSSGLVALPSNVNDPTQQIAVGCGETQGSRFVATGRGGVPENPIQQVSYDRPWQDLRDVSSEGSSSRVQTPQTPLSPFVEATGWTRNAQGQPELIAQERILAARSPSDCRGTSVNFR